MKLSIGISVSSKVETTLHVIDHVLQAAYANCWMIKVNIVDSVSGKAAFRRIIDRYRLIPDEKTIRQVKTRKQESSWLFSQVGEADYYLKLRPSALVTPTSLKRLITQMEKSEVLSIPFPGGVLYRIGPGDDKEDT